MPLFQERENLAVKMVLGAPLQVDCASGFDFRGLSGRVAKLFSKFEKPGDFLGLSGASETADGSFISDIRLFPTLCVEFLSEYPWICPGLALGSFVEACAAALAVR